MRTDLNKLLCERERLGHTANFGMVRRNKMFSYIPNEDSEDPCRESMMFRHARASGIGQKQLNENLNPLYGTVRKAVGRPWDAFYSDLCKVFDKRSVINQHILQHLHDFVETNTYLQDGKIMVRDRWGRDHDIAGSQSEYYVHPTTKIILLNKYRMTYKQRMRISKAKKEEEKLKVFRQIDEYNILHKINNVWYHFELKDVPDRKIIGHREDSFTPQLKHPIWSHEYPIDVFRVDTDWKNASLNGYHYNPYVSPKKYHFRKRTASHKLLKQHGLAV